MNLTSLKVGGFILGVLLLAILAMAGIVVVRGSQNSHSRPPGHTDITFDVSRDGSQVVFSAGGKRKRDLFLLDLSSGAIRRLTSSEDYEILPSFSPDAKQVVFTRGISGIRADQVCILDLASGRIEQLTQADENCSTPIFSGDGKEIVYAVESHYRWGGLASSWSERGTLTWMNLKTRKVEKVSNSSSTATDPAVSPDGQWIAWVDEDRGIQSAKFDDLSHLRSFAKRGHSPTFSQDGRQLAYITGQYSPDLHVVIAPAAGGDGKAVPNTESAAQVRLLPNGRLLVLKEFWRSGMSGTPTRGLWEYRPDGSGAREVISEAVFSGEGTVSSKK